MCNELENAECCDRCNKPADELFNVSAVGSATGNKNCESCFEILQDETPAEVLPLLYELVQDPDLAYTNDLLELGVPYESMSDDELLQTNYPLTDLVMVLS